MGVNQARGGGKEGGRALASGFTSTLGLANKKWALLELALVTYSGSVLCKARSESRTALAR
jgi:hypothetical protein